MIGCLLLPFPIQMPSSMIHTDLSSERERSSFPFATHPKSLASQLPTYISSSPFKSHASGSIETSPFRLYGCPSRIREVSEELVNALRSPAYWELPGCPKLLKTCWQAVKLSKTKQSCSFQTGKRSISSTSLQSAIPPSLLIPLLLSWVLQKTPTNEKLLFYLLSNIIHLSSLHCWRAYVTIPNCSSNLQ